MFDRECISWYDINWRLYEYPVDRRISFALRWSAGFVRDWLKLEYIAKPAVILALFFWLWTSAGLNGALLWSGLFSLLRGCVADDLAWPFVPGLVAVRACGLCDRVQHSRAGDVRVALSGGHYRHWRRKRIRRILLRLSQGKVMAPRDFGFVSSSLMILSRCWNWPMLREAGAPLWSALAQSCSIFQILFSHGINLSHLNMDASQYCRVSPRSNCVDCGSYCAIFKIPLNWMARHCLWISKFWAEFRYDDHLTISNQRKANAAYFLLFCRTLSGYYQCKPHVEHNQPTWVWWSIHCPCGDAGSVIPLLVLKQARRMAKRPRNWAQVYSVSLSFFNELYDCIGVAGALITLLAGSFRWLIVDHFGWLARLNVYGHSAHDRARCGDAWCVADGEISLKKKDTGSVSFLFIIQRHNILMDQMRVPILQTDEMILDRVRFGAFEHEILAALHAVARDLAADCLSDQLCQ